MRIISEITQNHIIICATVAWFFAQLLKIPFLYLTDRVFSLKRFWGSGGMPSSHTSLLVSASVLIGYLHGYNSALFGLSVIITSVVMYDATGVRRETGAQSTVINEIIRRIFEGEKISDKDLKELVGHTPLEVWGGFILGITVAWIYISIFF